MKTRERDTNPLSSNQHGKGLQAALRILERWGCKANQKQAILQISKAAYHNYQKSTDKVQLSNDQLTRVSYVLNMHQSLRIVFSNPDNVYGFMTMTNNNPFFNGVTPLSLIDTGSIGNLHEVFKRIDALRGAGY